MKRIVCICFCLLAQLGLAQPYVPTTATIVVRDDRGQPVGGVSLDGGFRDVSNAGARDRFEGVTDTNGVFVAKGSALIGVGVRARAEGYYETVTSIPLDPGEGVEVGHWDITIPVVLKRMRHPIPMYSRAVANPYISTFESVGKYRLHAISQYDLLNGQFVSPHGDGIVGDLRYNWNMVIYSTNKAGRALDMEMNLEISMPNGVDGICRGISDGGKGDSRNEGSAYLSAYEAPTHGYTNRMSLYWKVNGTNSESNDDGHDLYYFRIRTQTNEAGVVTNALYGKIIGQINGRFTYYLNPTPNDRNVEFDPKQNLFTNLAPLEAVSVP